MNNVIIENFLTSYKESKDEELKQEIKFLLGFILKKIKSIKMDKEYYEMKSNYLENIELWEIQNTKLNELEISES